MRSRWQHFLERKIGFREIHRIIAKTMKAHTPRHPKDVDEILEVDRWARERASSLILTATKEKRMENIIYSIVAAVIGLGILIVIHEFGHFLFAKFSGVGVLTFSVGFGPKLWVKKKGETEYALSAFPLGGYVKMVGEDPEEEVQPADIERSFAHKSLLKRIAIVAAGPGFNLFSRWSFCGCVCFLWRAGAVDSGGRCRSGFAGGTSRNSEGRCDCRHQRATREGMGGAF